MQKIKSTFLLVMGKCKDYALVILVVALSVMGVLLFRNKKSMDTMKNEIEILRAKYQIEKLAAEKAVLVADLQKMKHEDSEIGKAIKAIEEKTKAALSQDLTTEEIITLIERIYGK